MPNDTERWLPIPGFDGYDVSDQGRIRSWKRSPGPRIMKQTTVSDGYLAVRCNGTLRRVHLYVLAAFVGPLPEGQETRHLNGVRDDNRLDNLRYGTKMENGEDRRLHQNGRRSHCPKGHPYDDENTYVYTDRNGLTSRNCRTCIAEAQRRYREKNTVTSASQ